jgi:hypothetical protein
MDKNMTGRTEDTFNGRNLFFERTEALLEVGFFGLVDRACYSVNSSERGNNPSQLCWEFRNEDTVGLLVFIGK